MEEVNETETPSESSRWGMMPNDIQTLELVEQRDRIRLRLPVPVIVVVPVQPHQMPIVHTPLQTLIRISRRNKRRPLLRPNLRVQLIPLRIVKV